jgi:hypothetical protein
MMDHKAEQLAVLAQNVADLQEELRSIGEPAFGGCTHAAASPQLAAWHGRVGDERQ